ncbi:MAG: orotate phosphoribosyltransferase [Pseudomonadales bacterium]|nr:orotate phosphoribosyltransferase [Pseudomonadales bacterium]
MLESYQEEFIQFAIEQKVLQFGEFKLKSGRISPYFFNAGGFNSGAALARLGGFYAEALLASKVEYDLLFGPAYKGIPLVSATAIALATEQGLDIPYVFNRKEKKEHGEGGNLVGAPLKGRVVIVDDVITAGTAIREVMELLSVSEAIPVAVMVAIDREERGTNTLSAIQEVENDYGVTVISIVKLRDKIAYLASNGSDSNEMTLMARYQKEYGID